MNKIRRLLPIFWLSLWGIQTSNGHPVHATFAEAQWNHKTTEIEVSLRLRGMDLESAISKTTGKKVDLEKSTNIDQLIEDYLAKNFYVISPTEKKSVRSTWIRMSELPTLGFSSHLKLEAIKISKVLRSEILYSLMTLRVRKT